ncbi:MAG: arylformamidase [Stappiaceae bacterium]
MSEVIDVSPALRPGMAVFPGDAAYSTKPTFEIGPDCPVNVAEFSMSCHCGAHVDAPLHYQKNGLSIDQLPLEEFIGPARVIDARGSGSLCQPEDILPHLEGNPSRILLRLAESLDPMIWPKGFRALAPETIKLLAERGVTLIGVDVPSVDPETSKELPAHMMARDQNMHIVENLLLQDVSVGDYELICLPLKLYGLDAAPVRAVLRPLPGLEDQ